MTRAGRSYTSVPDRAGAPMRSRCARFRRVTSSGEGRGVRSREARAEYLGLFFVSSRRRHTRSKRDWSSDVCSSDLAAYRAGQVAEDDMCGEMVSMHRGLSENLVQAAANRYFDENFVRQIFPEMRALVQKLQEQGSLVWAVSSTNQWMIRAGMRYFGIPQERILAAAVEVRDGIITDLLTRVPSGDGKPQAIRATVSGPLDIAFGNSRWDM